MNGWSDWISFWAMAACGALSAFPFRFARGGRVWPVATMVLGLGIYLAGDSEAPAGAAATTALMMFVWLNGMAKLGLLQLAMAWSGGSRRRMRAMPQRRIQLAVAATILMVCAQWFSSMGGTWRQLRGAYGLAHLRGVRSVVLSAAGIEAAPAPKSAECAGGG